MRAEPRIERVYEPDPAAAGSAILFVLGRRQIARREGQPTPEGLIPGAGQAKDPGFPPNCSAAVDSTTSGGRE